MAETELLTPGECAEYRRCSLRKLDRERARAAAPLTSTTTAEFSIGEATSTLF
jgi:hypothetical protein